jgi:hypothetical protein
MSGIAHNPQQEFWRPPVVRTELAGGRPIDACENCGTEFMVGSRFCHICGGTRESQVRNVDRSWTDHLEFHNIQQALGLSTFSLVAFVIGVACVIGAIACGMIYSERNMLEWQAVQMFRIEWLLGASAAFVAGILLKKTAK